jgi:hypothetical protein
MAMGTRQAASGSGRPGARFRHWVTRDVTAMAKANTSAQAACLDGGVSVSLKQTNIKTNTFHPNTCVLVWC